MIVVKSKKIRQVKKIKEYPSFKLEDFDEMLALFEEEPSPIFIIDSKSRESYETMLDKAGREYLKEFEAKMKRRKKKI